MSSQSPSLPASGSSNPGQASTPTTPVNSSAEGKPNSKSPAARSAEKPSNPKVVVQPVNPPMSISLPVDAPQSMFTITQQKHMLETAKVPAAASVAPIVSNRDEISPFFNWKSVFSKPPPPPPPPKKKF